MQLLANYKLVEPLGRGAQGSVHRALNTVTGDVVAVKVVRDGPYACPKDRHRFLGESNLLQTLHHPCIVPIIDTGAPHGVQYFAMPFIIGEHLDIWAMKHAPLADPGSLSKRIGVFQEVCAALSYAHEKGVIHRDLKPSNILVDVASSPKVVDFGAAITGEDPGGEVCGTFSFAAPEQMSTSRARDVCPRSDVYSLGVLLFILLTDQHPFGDDFVANERHYLHKAPPPLASKLNREVHSDLAKIVSKSMAWSPGDRYATASELANDIRSILQGDHVNVVDPFAWSRRRLKIRKMLLPLIIGLAAAAISIPYLTTPATPAADLNTAVNLASDAARSNDWATFLHQARIARDGIVALEDTSEFINHEIAAEYRSRIYSSLDDRDLPRDVRQWLASDPEIPGLARAISANMNRNVERIGSQARPLVDLIVGEMSTWDRLDPSVITETSITARTHWSQDPQYEAIESILPMLKPTISRIAALRVERSAAIEE